jgi:hypothetical protein
MRDGSLGDIQWNGIIPIFLVVSYLRDTRVFQMCSEYFRQHPCGLHVACLSKPVPEFGTMADPKQPGLFANQKTSRDIVRVEKNLNTFGFFTPLHKRTEKIREKRVTILVREHEGQRAEAYATILPSAKLGLPTTADQDKFYAFQKLLDHTRRRNGSISNPVAFTSSELLKLLKRKKSGQSYREISDWLERMTLTGIRSEGVIWLAGRKSYARDTFTVFSRTVTVGQELPDGHIADQNYVWLSEWQLENLNHSYVLPIDYEVYCDLKFNISKALVPLIQIWFYAARRNPNTAIEKRYSELCEFLSLRRYAHLSKIKEVMGPSLDELIKKQVLQYWEIDRTADGADFKLLLIPGDRFLNENRARLAGREDSNAMIDPGSQAALKALTERGIHQERARRLLLDLPEGQPVEDQIEYGDFEIKRRAGTRHKIANPAGFYIYLVENNFPVPADFETSRKRLLRQALEDRDQRQKAKEAEEFLRKQALREEYQAYRDSETDRYIAANLSSEQLKIRINAAKLVITKERSELRLPEPALHDFAVRRVRESLSEEAKPLSFEDFCRDRQQRLPI